MVRTATLDLNSRGSFVDDLNSKPGIVMCRDALLHRSHEIQLAFLRFGRKKQFFCFFLHFFFIFPSPGTCTWHENSGAAVRPRASARYRSGDLARFFGLYGGHRPERARLQRKLRGWTVQDLRPNAPQAYLLGLLAKIKCSICSYQLNLWYVAHGVTSD